MEVRVPSADASALRACVRGRPLSPAGGQAGWGGGVGALCPHGPVAQVASVSQPHAPCAEDLAVPLLDGAPKAPVAWTQGLCWAWHRVSAMGAIVPSVFSGPLWGRPLGSGPGPEPPAWAKPSMPSWACILWPTGALVAEPGPGLGWGQRGDRVLEPLSQVPGARGIHYRSRGN